MRVSATDKTILKYYLGDGYINAKHYMEDDVIIIKDENGKEISIGNFIKKFGKERFLYLVTLMARRIFYAELAGGNFYLAFKD